MPVTEGCRFVVVQAMVYAQLNLPDICAEFEIGRRVVDGISTD